LSLKIFSSTPSFCQAFSAGLSSLLQGGGLGPFILVCANATFDPKIHSATAAELEALYRRLREQYVQALESGRAIQEVEEDLLVFLKIQAVGLEKLRHTERRQAGKWELQFNHLRSFRPKRTMARAPAGMHVDFDEAGFHFNKGFMQKEAFWAGTLGGKDATLYYNKYPFVDFHALLVPERESKLPQFLTLEHHNYLWALTSQLAETLTGVGFGYNSIGAFASVNHLHFQMFLKPQGFPVMDAAWSHNGGGEPYPAQCLAFDEPRAAWSCIQMLHSDEIAYNLLYTPGRQFVFPRLKQGAYLQPAWTSGFTWHELAGGIVVFNCEDYENLDASTIRDELARLAVGDLPQGFD
jgi:diadenosine tetraphosphate (Ap4A) HIT family hydrolase